MGSKKNEQEMYDKLQMTAGQKRTYRSIRFLIFSFSKVWFRLEVRGKENIPSSGAFILAAGAHRSYVDTPLISLASSRILRYLGASTYFSKPGLGSFLSAMGGVPVKRSSTDREALQLSQTVLESGEPLAVFPEGARFSGPRIDPLKEGTAFLACRAKVPVIPVGIGGGERSMPKGSPWVKPRKMVLYIGKPLPVPEVEGRIKRSAIQSFSEEIEQELQKAFDSAQIAAGL